MQKGQTERSAGGRRRQKLLSRRVAPPPSQLQEYLRYLVTYMGDHDRYLDDAERVGLRPIWPFVALTTILLLAR